MSHIERVVLFWVQNLKQSRTRVTVEVVLRKFIDLVEKDDWIESTSFAESLNTKRNTSGTVT
jgi:hypothetical protein